MGWIGCAIYQVTPKRLPRFLFHIFRIFFFNYFIKNPQTTIAPKFLTHIISAIGGVSSYLSYSIVRFFFQVFILYSLKGKLQFNYYSFTHSSKRVWEILYTACIPTGSAMEYRINNMTKLFMNLH